MESTENKTTETLRAEELKLTAIYQSSGKEDDLDKLIKYYLNYIKYVNQNI